MEKKVTLLRSQVLSTCTQSLIKDLSRPHRTYCMVKTNITMFIRMFFISIYIYNIKQIILVKSVLNAVNSCSITTVCIYRKSQFCRYWRLMFAQVCTAQLYTTTHKYDHIHLTLAGRPGSLLVKTHIMTHIIKRRVHGLVPDVKFVAGSALRLPMFPVHFQLSN